MRSSAHRPVHFEPTSWGHFDKFKLMWFIPGGNFCFWSFFQKCIWHLIFKKKREKELLQPSKRSDLLQSPSPQQSGSMKLVVKCVQTSETGKKKRVRWTLEGSNKSFKVDVFSNNQCSPTVPRSWCLRNLKQMRQIPKDGAVLICFDLYDQLATYFFPDLLCLDGCFAAAMSSCLLGPFCFSAFITQLQRKLYDLTTSSLGPPRSAAFRPWWGQTGKHAEFQQH